MSPRKADARPLYAKVHAALVERIRSGEWKAGELIPNEFEIAAEFKVSQGTARKAISALADENLVVRRQGRGTYVYEHTPDDILLRFLNFFDSVGQQIAPGNRSTRREVSRASLAERKALSLPAAARVIRFDRIRTRGRKPFITECVVLPERMFPGLADSTDIPDSFYDIFQKTYGVLVTRTDERLTATVADKEAARELAIAAGTPLLRIERTAYTLDNRAVEWRVSLCHLDRAYYLARTR
jgi:GntR family transcriptional regulator